MVARSSFAVWACGPSGADRLVGVFYDRAFAEAWVAALNANDPEYDYRLAAE